MVTRNSRAGDQCLYIERTNPGGEARAELPEGYQGLLQLAQSGLGKAVIAVCGDKAHDIDVQRYYGRQNRVVAFYDQLEGVDRLAIERCGGRLHNMVRIEEMRKLIDVLNDAGEAMRKFLRF